VLTADRLRELFEYDPDSGLFVSIRRNNNRFPAGRIAGTLDKAGYVVIHIDGRVYKAHRLAWLYMTGEWPKKQMDHINLVKADNRWVNLREATHAQNMANRTSYGKSGFKGVVWNESAKKWQAQLKADGKQEYLGVFATKEEAHAAYCKAAQERFGGFFRKQ
jgi:hypothetical protein